MPSKGLAIVALGFGLVGLFTGGLLGLGSLAGLVLAGVALYRASSQPERYAGKDVAWAAVAANAFALATLVPLALAVTTFRPLLFPPDPGLPDPIPESQRFFDEGSGAAPVPPPPPPPPPPPAATAASGGVAGGTASPRRETAPVRIGGNIREPRKLHHVSPAYPDIAKQARVQGIVILECVITAEGNVGKVTVLRSPALLMLTR